MKKTFIAIVAFLALFSLAAFERSEHTGAKSVRKATLEAMWGERTFSVNSQATFSTLTDDAGDSLLKVYAAAKTEAAEKAQDFPR